MGYTINREELINCSNKVFDKIKNGDVKTNIFKKFKLNQAREAHKTLQSRESFGSIILEPKWRPLGESNSSFQDENLMS